jgi:acetylornithine/N-succinyldiaminopimelate aminotransferase
MEEFECITERRGVGFMQGLVFDCPVGPIINDAMDHGLIMINAGPNILRFVPALITERQHIDEMAQILRGAIERNTKKTGK